MGYERMSKHLISGESQEAAIRSYLDLIIRQESDRLSIEELMAEIGEYYDADRSYVFERDPSGRFTSNTYEWCAPGVQPEIDNLQGIPIEVIEPWIAEFRNNGSFYIECNEEYERRNPVMYGILKPQGIETLMAAPVVVSGDIVGFLGVDNPKRHIEHQLFISITATSIIKEKMLMLEKEADIFRKSLITSLSTAYFCLYYVDIRNDRFRELSVPSVEAVSEYIGNGGSAREKFVSMSKFLVVPEQAEEILEFTNLSTIAERLRDRNSIGIHFNGPHVGWCEGMFVVANRDSAGECTHVLWAVRSIKQEKEKDMRYQAELQEALAAAKNANEAMSDYMHVIKGLSSEYVTVWLVHYPSLTMQLYQDTGASKVDDAIKQASEAVNYLDARKNYIDKYVHPDDYERVCEETTPRAIQNALSAYDIYKVSFRRVINGDVEYYQMCFARAKNSDDSQDFVLGFKNVDYEYREELQKNRQLEKAIVQAEAANNAKTMFLNNMSHDIRTPMNAILGFATLMSKELNNPVAMAEYLRKLQDSGSYLLSIINNVLDIARIDSGKMTLEETYVNLYDNSDVFLSIFDEEIKRKNITFIDSMEITHSDIICDAVKMRQIWVNIVSNAIKYTPYGGTIKLMTEELPCEMEGYATYRIICADTGIGMSKDFIPTIFDYFTREHNTTESKVLGTGLGMPIVKKLVDLMGATMEIESELGVGTTFTVTITHKLATETQKYVEQQSEYAVEQLNLKGRRLLLAEDNDFNAEIAITILEDAGLTVERAEDGVVCIDMLNKTDSDYYDAILMDIQMPNMDGYKAAQTIRALPDSNKASIPIIAITANAFAEDKIKAIEAGMNDHVAKPIDVRELMNALSKVLQ